MQTFIFIIQKFKNNSNILKMVFLCFLLGFLVGLHSPLYSIFPLYPLFFIWALFKHGLSLKQRFLLSLIYSGFLHVTFFLVLFKPFEIHFTNFFLFQGWDNVFIVFCIFFLLSCLFSLYFGYFYEFLYPWLFMLLLILVPRPIAYILIIGLFFYGFTSPIARLSFVKIIYGFLILLFFIALKAQIFPDLLPASVFVWLTGSELPTKQCSKVFCSKYGLEQCVKMCFTKYSTTSSLRIVISHYKYADEYNKTVRVLESLAKDNIIPQQLVTHAKQTDIYRPMMIDNATKEIYPLTTKGDNILKINPYAQTNKQPGFTSRYSGHYYSFNDNEAHLFVPSKLQDTQATQKWANENIDKILENQKDLKKAGKLKLVPGKVSEICDKEHQEVKQLHQQINKNIKK